jgi:hypothetical protein
MIFEKKFQLSKIEEIGIISEIHEKIDIAFRALLLSCIRSEEPNPPDFVIPADLAGQKSQGIHDLRS